MTRLWDEYRPNIEEDHGLARTFEEIARKAKGSMAATMCVLILGLSPRRIYMSYAHAAVIGVI